MIRKTLDELKHQGDVANYPSVQDLRNRRDTQIINGKMAVVDSATAGVPDRVYKCDTSEDALLADDGEICIRATQDGAKGQTNTDGTEGSVWIWADAKEVGYVSFGTSVDLAPDESQEITSGSPGYFDPSNSYSFSQVGNESLLRAVGAPFVNDGSDSKPAGSVSVTLKNFGQTTETANAIQFVFNWANTGN